MYVYVIVNIISVWQIKKKKKKKKKTSLSHQYAPIMVYPHLNFRQ